ncbi:5'-nucleotidase C-terminal domain-containing protein [Candidatus Bipolaricaulota bacterium]|nr:5'-nucleotidase C-terminal domain-containing protein [Candidatus Bipolaricaulota bacterium]
MTEARLISLYGNYIGENKATVGTIYGSDLEGFLLQRGQAYDNVDLQVAGVDVTYKEKGGKISDIETDLNPEKTYSVSFNSYAYGSDYAPVDGFTEQYTTESTEKEMLLDYVAGLDVVGEEVAEDRVKVE